MIGSTHQQGVEYSSNNAGDGPEDDDEAWHMGRLMNFKTWYLPSYKSKSEACTL